MIFFDFDGTIAHVWPRYHQAFLTASGITGVPLSDYREVKQTLVSDREVARHFGIELSEEYFLRKRNLLESEELLRLDTLLIAPEELEIFFFKYECRILTSRRRADAFLNEMETLGLGGIAGQAIILDSDCGVSKKDFLEQNFSIGAHIVVGDSEAEWEAARLENVCAVLVQTGSRMPESFSPTKRCRILPSIQEFIAIYMKRGTELCPSRQN